MFIKALPKTPKTKSGAAKAAVQTSNSTSTVPGEKKRGRKRKVDDAAVRDKSTEPQPSTSKAGPSPKKSGSVQSSLMRFLTADHRRPPPANHDDLDSGFSQDFQASRSLDDPYAHLRPSDVRLLSSDSDALDFLTLCAMKRSSLATEPEPFFSEARRAWLPYDAPELPDDPFAELELPSSVRCLEAISRLAICDDGDEPEDSLLSYWPGDEEPERCDDTPLQDYDHDEFQAVESKYTRRRSESNDSWLQLGTRAEAAVEVDFEAILDENTSSSEALLTGQANMFEDLLEGSDDEDLFADLDEEVARPAVGGGKRAASQSPCREADNKRQRLLPAANDESSDGEAVFGTPPRNKQASCSSIGEAGQSKSETAATVFYPDSDEDLFGDLDFETQFSPDRTNATVVEQGTEDQAIVGKAESSCGAKGGSEAAVNEIVKKEEPVEEVTIKEEKEEASKVVKSEAETCQGISNGLEIDLELEDWDDFELAPVMVAKPRSPQEKFSSFFAAGTSSGSSKPSSTGWISTGQQKKPLSLKSLNSQRGTSERTKPPSSGLDVQKNYRLEIGKRPILQWASLKSMNRDKDGFALPAKPVSRVTSAEKENAAPVAAKLEMQRRSPSSSVSPRFRKYHSESSLCERQPVVRRRKKGRRRRLAREFIEEEAQVSSDYDTSAGSSDEDGLHDLGDFVSYTQVHEDDEAVDMRAHYLRTINSPVRPGAFIIKEMRRRACENFDVYSQPVSQAEDTYMHDSFCVGDETQVAANDSDGLSNDSILESIECALESRRKKMKERRKMKFKELEDKRKRKKNEKDSNSSESTNYSSSEDETEALRRQVLEESLQLKK